MTGGEPSPLRSFARILPAALSGIVAFTLVLLITEVPGPGLDPDALSYMGAAESVALHREYRIPLAKWASADSTEPLAHFPPAYPTALALPVRLGMAPAQGARLVEATAAFVTVTALVLLVGAVATTVAGVLLAVALMGMTSMHEVHVSVLSEPLYLASLVLGIGISIGLGRVYEEIADRASADSRAAACPPPRGPASWAVGRRSLRGGCRRGPI